MFGTMGVTELILILAIVLIVFGAGKLPKIGEEVHGNGANIDNLETRDGRRLLPNTCFSIEPGIYLPGEFGIRSEVDVYLTQTDALVTGIPIQTAIIPILAT